jgi:hypothetical protein
MSNFNKFSKSTAYNSEAKLGKFLAQLYPNSTLVPQVKFGARRIDYGVNVGVTDYCRVMPILRQFEIDQIPTGSTVVLLVEYDGHLHYTSNYNVHNDATTGLGFSKWKQLDKFTFGLRIPYWLQLDTVMTQFWFRQSVDFSSGFPHGFVSDKVRLPELFCASGTDRFVTEMDSIPRIAANQVYNSLAYQIGRHNNNTARVMTTELHATLIKSFDGKRADPAAMPTAKDENVDFPNSVPQPGNTIAVGAKFGLWTTVFVPVLGKKILCRCVCGVEKKIDKHKLTKGLSSSCGCNRVEKAKATFVEHYGVSNPMQVPEVRAKASRTAHETAAKRADLLAVGDRFSSLVVSATVPGKASTVECRCDCGMMRMVRASELRNGSVKSCGCKRSENISLGKISVKIATGYRFNEIEVIETKQGANFLCKCSCGVILELPYRTIKMGKKKTCGHDLKGAAVVPGAKFGLWTVLEGPAGKPRVECRCDCGTVKSLAKGTLLAGQSKSCGCNRRENLINSMIDAGRTEMIPGKQFEKWTLTGPGEGLNNGSFVCICGTKRTLAYQVVREGKSKGCGCLD